MIFNDPNGHSDHGIEVMQTIARRIPRSDFLIVVNEGSLRPSGDDHASRNAAAIEGARRAAAQYAWMLLPDRSRVDAAAWARRLGKRHAVISRGVYGNHAFQGGVMLLTNYVANINEHVFRRVL